MQGHLVAAQQAAAAAAHLRERRVRAGRGGRKCRLSRRHSDWCECGDYSMRPAERFVMISRNLPALAAIPEASLLCPGLEGPSAGLQTDVEVALKAEKMKMIKNEGNSDLFTSKLSFDNAAMLPNLENIGISFRNVEGN
jgi:hypothetical protein